jgi:hypothetical protein
MCGVPPKVYKSSNMAVCLVGGFGEIVACADLQSLAFVLCGLKGDIGTGGSDQI